MTTIAGKEDAWSRSRKIRRCPPGLRHRGAAATFAHPWRWCHAKGPLNNNYDNGCCFYGPLWPVDEPECNSYFLTRPKCHSRVPPFIEKLPRNPCKNKLPAHSQTHLQVAFHPAAGVESVPAQKEGTLADSQYKARFLTFVRNDKRCCRFDRREKSLAPGIIE